MTKPMRMFSTNLTGEREFYVSRAYRDEGPGVLITGSQYDITADVRPYLVKAQRDMAGIIKDQLLLMRETLPDDPTFDEVIEVLDDEIAGRTEAS